MIKEVKKYWDKFWFIIWKDDSLKGWVLSVLFIFIFIRFIFFPILSVSTGTDLPLAIVESCSMYHKGNLFSNFNSWYDRHDDKYSELGISKTGFSEFGFTNGFNKGDILFILGANAGKLKEGDVIIFNTGSGNPIIHRVVGIQENNGERIFSTIGDNNNGQLPFEKQIRADQIVGHAVFRIAPYFGWVKLVFFEPFRYPSERGFCNEN